MPRRGQRTGWAAVGAGEETVPGSRSTARSGLSRKSGWTAAGGGVSAVWDGATRVSVSMTYIVFGEQVERAEHFVVFDVKGACSLKVTLEGEGGGGLDVELLGSTDLAELFVVLLGRDSRGPPGSAVVVVWVRVELRVVVGTVVEELRRHGGWCGVVV